MRESLRFAAYVAAVTISSSAFAGDPSFTRLELSTKFYCEGASFADVDKDGHADILSGPFWYRGPDFKEAHEIYEPKEFDPAHYSDNFFAFPYDFNGDGWIDVLVVGFPGEATNWFENPKGAKTRWTKHLVVEHTDNESPSFGDIDGDKKPDLIFQTGGKLGWASADWKHPEAPWTFHAASEDLKLGNFTHGLGWGDVNGDGKPDLLLAIGWWEQPASLAGDPVWKFHDTKFSDQYGGAQMYVYDVDGDGLNDVITSMAAHHYGLSWFQQVKKDGAISFVEHKIMSSKPEEVLQGVQFGELHALDLIDVDGDGLKDIVMGKRWWSHGAVGDPDKEKSKAWTYWWGLTRPSKGEVKWTPHLITDDVGVGVQVVAGDVNGDGKPDVVVGNKKGTFVLLQNAAKPATKAKDEKQKMVGPKMSDGRTSNVWSEPAPQFKVGAGDTQSSFDLILPDGAAEIHYDTPDSSAAGFLGQSQADAGSLPLGDDGKPLNTDFETGDLRDWTISGGAFVGQPIEGDTVTARGREPALQQGKYWIGGYEKVFDGGRGSMTSKPFRVTKPWASFLVGGGSFHDERVELVFQDDNQVFFRTSGANFESMQRIVVDLSRAMNRSIFIRITDDATGGWGHINFDDFRLFATKPSYVLPQGVPQILTPDTIVNAGLPAEAAAKAMTVPPGFHVDLIASEPNLQQPIAFTFDAKGRIWVVEAFSYPQRRAEGQGLDDIVVFESTKHDGKFDKRTTFAKGLNLASGIELGYGGVFVAAAPYLMFIPDRNDDLVPDGPPEMLLDGWGYGDTHEVPNALIWGPDGWLYGCYGVFNDGNVGRPDAPDEPRTPMNAGVWRYQPIKKKFEVFAWGTSNPWGVDFNDDGQCFITACVIPHLYHMIQGARYERQAGDDFNPYIFDDIKTIADHRHYLGTVPHGGNNRSNSAGGGHAHCGAMIYLADQFPAEYRNSIFMGNVHGNRFNNDKLVREGSGYVGKHGDDFILANDAWFRGINIKYGPDGACYFIDWYDKQACHWTEVERWDRTNGRLYRVEYGNYKPVTVDLRKLSDDALVDLQTNKNDWYVRQARLILSERKSGASSLKSLLARDSDPRHQLRALWALHASGAANADLLAEQLNNPNEYVVGWAIQLLFEDKNPPESVYPKLAELARNSKSQVVRLYIASALQRMRLYDRWPIAEALIAHGEDAKDHNLPLLYWYGIEPLVPQNPERAFELAKHSKLELISRYIVRRAASSPLAHEALTKTLDAAAPKDRNWMLEEAANELRDQRGLSTPKSWPVLYAKLSKDTDAATRERSLAIAVAFGDPSALGELRGVLIDAKAPVERREKALDSLVAARDAALGPVLEQLLDVKELRDRSIKALSSYDVATAPQSLITRFASLSMEEKRDAVNTLSSRATWAVAMLDAVASGAIRSSDVPAAVLNNLRNLKDPHVDAQVTAIFGAVRDTPEAKLKRINELKGLLTPDALAHGDKPRGREIFSRTCMQCHTLFGVGGTLAPDITGSNRADLDYLLSNVVDPSAVVGKDYQAWIVELKAGQILTGIVKKETPDAITLATENDVKVIARSEIESSKRTENSMMPEGQLDALSAKDVVDLIAYLQSPTQTPMLATKANSAQFFDGKSLAHWHSDVPIWSVEDGEIVGKTPGIQANDFLKSDFDLRDFKLSLDIKLLKNEGNSGIQFRTLPLEGGEVKGYQADVGPGWWGKLYEENGRGIVVDKGGEDVVKSGDWNHYEIEAVGHKVTARLNGSTVFDLDDPAGALSGITAIQVHAGGATEVRVRNLQLEVLE